eukprot:TRINITY_DN5407_c0_g2_i1.p1 TRINITY_DN5407_c0_g2~~TRINITY_DN5407_c0_g2_i1.p1  ORF type:complete len:793 (+),score=132.37 TRINITY_DN5407_c0_g2_i1:49-2379(+)
METAVEYLDVLSRSGKWTGVRQTRKRVHAEGLYHRAVHVWLYAESTNQVLLQKRASQKDSWPGLWDISSAGHISGGGTSLNTARRELQEELGLLLPESAFEYLFEYIRHDFLHGGAFVNNEWDDVYLVTLLEPIPLEAFVLQSSEVEAVEWRDVSEYEESVKAGDPHYCPLDVRGEESYAQLFKALRQRYAGDPSARLDRLQAQLERFKPVTLSAELGGLSSGDRDALSWIVQASKHIDRIYTQQTWATAAHLKEELEDKANSEHATALDACKLQYHNINKGPWSVLDEDDPFLTCADSKAIEAPKGAAAGDPDLVIRFRSAFPQTRPAGSNFYPADMDKEEFEQWQSTLSGPDKEASQGFFSVIRRESSADNLTQTERKSTKEFDEGESYGHLRIVPYHVEYKTQLEKAASCLSNAALVADTQNLKDFLWERADALLTDDYLDSDRLWLNLDSPIDVTFGPYETYDDGLFGYKASYESFVGIRDDDATAKVKLFGDYLQELEDHLPEPDEFKHVVQGDSLIRVVRLVYDSGDVKGPLTIAFNLPNDERTTKDYGTAMVMMANVSQAKFDSILLPIAETLVSPEQREDVTFDAFYIHTLCHEVCHGIGPHTITAPDGSPSTVREALQSVYSAFEEAKADIVGLWALHYLLDKGLVPASFARGIYVSFLASCFRSVRFGLKEAHGKGQALQLNWLLEHGAFGYNEEDGTFAVDFDQVREAVRELSRTILTIQGEGNKTAAEALLEKYSVVSAPMQAGLDRLTSLNVPVDIAPTFQNL